jgi:cytochrome P450/NADPH-cytochrome P450 reductase
LRFITSLHLGHETTSGLLSFAMLNLLQTESAYRAAQQEVDTVFGTGPVQIEQLKKLDYLNAVLRETLRLTPTATAMSKSANPKFQGQATLGQGRYSVEPSTRILALLGTTQRDPKVYGEDANKFKPERMLGDNFKNLPNAAWKVRPSSRPRCVYLLKHLSHLEPGLEPALDVPLHGKKH